jgi:hypothetical protein
MRQALKLAIPECRLTETAAGSQIARYRQLAEHVVEVERDIGELRVRFDETVPEGLLAGTLGVERECCSFLGLHYQPQTRSLMITVANLARDARLDTLRALLTHR